MNIKTIAIGCDHAGFPYKQAITTLLTAHGIQITDFGTDSEASVDYPDFVHPVAEQVATATVDLGILMCGSGNGVCMTANKHRGIRAALCWNDELASLARQHNNANILCIPVRFVDEKTALDMVKAFVNTDFEGGRHERRVSKINV